MTNSALGPDTQARAARRARHAALVARAATYAPGTKIATIVYSRAFPDGERVEGTVIGPNGAFVDASTEYHSTIAIPVDKIID